MLWITWPNLFILHEESGAKVVRDSIMTGVDWILHLLTVFHCFFTASHKRNHYVNEKDSIFLCRVFLSKDKPEPFCIYNADCANQFSLNHKVKITATVIYDETLVLWGRQDQTLKFHFGSGNSKAIWHFFTFWALLDNTFQNIIIVASKIIMLRLRLGKQIIIIDI